VRLAYLCFDFGIPVLGTKGASVHLRETVDALRGLGHTVQVYSPGQGLEKTEVQWDDWCATPLSGFASDVVGLLASEDLAQCKRLSRELRTLLFAEYSQRVLLPALTAFRPDVIYERYSLLAYAGAELARRLGVPLLLEVNAPLTLEQARYRELVLKRTAEEVERKILNTADALIVVSKALADHARSFGVRPDRITVLPNGVNPERFNPGVSGEDVRARYNLDGKRVLGFVGTLKPWHDLETLVAAVRLLIKKDKRVHLLVVGDGSGADRLQSLEEDHITLTGSVSYEEVPRFMAAMDVIAVPYPAGGEPYFSPLKLFEAMAMAKPAVGARVGQVAEVLVHGETGLLYEPGCPADLANQASRFFEHPASRIAMGAAARRDVLANRIWERNARQIGAIAGSLANASGVG